MSEAIAPVPEPFMKGTFAIYELPNGGRALAYRQEGEKETNHVVIPAPIIRLMEAQQRGEKVNPIQIIRTMMGGMLQ